MQCLVKIISTLVFTFVVGAALAQEPKVLVSVTHSGTDSVGQRLAFAVREAVRSSSGYRLATGSEATHQISLVTIDPERSPASAGYWTAAAVSYTMRNDLPLKKGDPQTWYPIYLTTQIILAGTSRVEEQAKSVLAALDEQVEQYRKDSKPR